MIRYAAAAALCLLAGAAGADPLEGLWRTAPDDNGNSGVVRIAPCGERYCGTLVSALGPSGATIDSDNLGKRILWDMQAMGGGAYGKGKIWAPDRDKTYTSKMTLAGDRVTVSGCVLVICREGGTWTRLR